MRRLSADAVIALVLIGAGGVMLNDLLHTKGSGAFVKTTTLPMALVVFIMLLALVLLATALLRPAPATGAKAGDVGGLAGGLVRVGALVVWLVLFVLALPWFGFLVTSAVFLVGASLIYGNRSPIAIAAVAIIVPVALLLFFEKFMIILLPAGHLFG